MWEGPLRPDSRGKSSNFGEVGRRLTRNFGGELPLKIAQRFNAGEIESPRIPVPSGTKEKSLACDYFQLD